MVMVKEAQAKYLTTDKEKQDVLKKGACPDGYKLTEVGVIPENWDLCRLSDVVDKIVGGGTPSRSVAEYWGYDIPWVTVKDFATFNPIQSQEYITKKGLKNSSSNLIPKGVLITSTRMALGKAVIYDVDVTINQDLKAIFPINDLNTIFLYFWFQHNADLIEELGSGSTVKGISLLDLRGMFFLKPPEIEQTAIAKALSDVDALITSLEKLIAKKQAIKTATMQQLLTGKKRLPGFGEGKGYKQTELGEIPEDWMCVKLVDIAELGTGNTPPTMDSSNYGSDYLFVSPSDLGWHKWVKNTDKKLSLKGFNLSRNFPANSILFTCIGSTIGKIGIAPFELTSNQQINAVFPNGSCNSEYIYYSLDYAVPRIKILAGHQAVPIINKTEFGETLIPLPTIKAEQTAIANVLSVMDSEIDLLENRLSKTQQIQQGMMQELLTGKTRLI